MFLVRWILFLLLSVVGDLAGVAPLGPAEALTEAEEALHRPRAVRPAVSQAAQRRVEIGGRVEPSRAVVRALQAARPGDPATAAAAVRKLPPPARAAGPSTEDH